MYKISEHIQKNINPIAKGKINKIFQEIYAISLDKNFRREKIFRRPQGDEIMDFVCVI